MKSEISVLIVDDESLAREAVRLRLQQHQGMKIIAEADNGDDALLLIDTLKPDVVFMDINMPKRSGLEASALIDSTIVPCLIFITAYDQHALEAFRLNALDYITKPIDDEVFNQVVEKAKTRVAERRAKQALSEKQDELAETKGFLKRISIKEEGEITLFNTADIFSVTSVKDYLCIKIKDKTYIQRQTMGQIASLLDPSIFVRCHRSHIVNRHCVSKWLEEDSATYLICGGEKIPVSRRYRKSVKAVLGL